MRLHGKHPRLQRRPIAQGACRYLLQATTLSVLYQFCYSVAESSTQQHRHTRSNKLQAGCETRTRCPRERRPSSKPVEAYRSSLATYHRKTEPKTDERKLGVAIAIRWRILPQFVWNQ